MRDRMAKHQCCMVVKRHPKLHHEVPPKHPNEAKLQEILHFRGRGLLHGSWNSPHLAKYRNDKALLSLERKKLMFFLCVCVCAHRFPTTSNSGPSLPRESRSNYPTRHSVASSNAVRSDDSAESDSNINLNMTDEDVVDCRKKIIEAFSMQNVCYEPFPFGPSLGDSSYSEYVRVDVGNAVKTQISEPGDATKKGLNVLFAERPRKDGFFTKNGIFIKKIGGGSYGTVYKLRISNLYSPLFPFIPLYSLLFFSVLWGFN